MTAKLHVVTGATGLLGSHIAEQLVARGERVRALVRPTADTAFLKSLGVELAVGDLGDPASLLRAVGGADVVYHSAARVGEWGTRRQFQTQVVDATRNLLDACRATGVGRVLHVSSMTVYGHLRPREELFTEDEPLGQNLWLWDYYCRAKIQAEELCRAYPGAWTIVRPSWMYGPRDRVSIPRFFRTLEAGRIVLIGAGDNKLNLLYAADVAEGAILAAEHPGAVGRAYHLGSEGEGTQRQLLDLMTDALGRPRVTRRLPYWLAFGSAFLLEAAGRALRLRHPPPISRYVISLIGRGTRFSIERARGELGWRPRVPVAEGLRRSLEWYYGPGGPVKKL